MELVQPGDNRSDTLILVFFLLFAAFHRLSTSTPFTAFTCRAKHGRVFPHHTICVSVKPAVRRRRPGTACHSNSHLCSGVSGSFRHVARLTSCVLTDTSRGKKWWGRSLKSLNNTPVSPQVYWLYWYKAFHPVYSSFLHHACFFMAASLTFAKEISDLSGTSWFDKA